MYDVFTYVYHKKSTIHIGKYTVRPMGWDGTGYPWEFVGKRKKKTNMDTQNDVLEKVTGPLKKHGISWYPFV